MLSPVLILRMRTQAKLEFILSSKGEGNDACRLFMEETRNLQGNHSALELPGHKHTACDFQPISEGIFTEETRDNQGSYFRGGIPGSQIHSL